MSYLTRRYLDPDNGVSTSRGLTAGTISNVGTEVEAENMMLKMRKAITGGNVVMKAVGAFIGAGAIVGVSQDLHHKNRAERLRREAEEDMDKQQRRDAKAMNQLFGYNKNIGMGQLVMDMWDDRTGHHKMGNSKFY